MILPTIHLNGTSAETLAEGYETAASALRKALECLQDVAPNGRDYYSQGDAAFARARGEHEARLVALRSVMSDLLSLHEHAQDAADARAARRSP